jgi:pilus assembly protein CpaB
LLGRYTEKNKNRRKNIMAKSRAFIPILLAAVIAFVGSFLIYKWVDSRTTPQKTIKVEQEAVEIAVSKIDLPWGTKLKEDNIKLVPYLKDSLPPGSFTDFYLDSLVGRVLLSPIFKDEPILESRLAPISVTEGGIAAVVRPGKRAIAVKGNEVLGLSGLIQPGNRVDVLVTLQDPRNKRDTTKLVLQSIPVLATGKEIVKNDKGEVSPVDVYTLEVDPEEGERLSLAATEGKLHFALRNATDDQTVLTKGATIPGTLAVYRGKNPVKKGAKKKSTWVKQHVYVSELRGTKANSRKF